MEAEVAKEGRVTKGNWMRNKRIIAVSDLHCGALYGLTPKAWQVQYKDKDKTRRNKWSKLMRELWDTYLRTLDSLAPIDYLFFLGDAIDGRGFRSGGTELITTDRNEQMEMACSCFDQIRMRGSKKFKAIGVYGTPYHTSSDGEDFEIDLVKDAGFEKMGSHEWPSVNGCVFDLKHSIGSSQIPHGRGTALLRDMLWNDVWAMDESQPKAKVLLRGHVHYYMGVDQVGKSGFSLPALCGMGSKFGSRICSGLVHWGMMHFDIDSKGNVANWDKHVVAIKAQKAEPHIM